MNWLLLRGLGREQRHWHGFPAALRDAVAPCAVHPMDLAGTGTECLRTPRPSIPWLARDVARRLSALPEPADGRWSIIGVSLGGMVALELCWLLQTRVDRAVIINASCSMTPVPRRLRVGALPELGRLLLTRDVCRREKAVLRLTSTLPRSQSGAFAESAARFALDAPVRGAVLISQLVAAARFQPPDRSSVPARLLFLASRRDALVSVRCSHDLARFYAAELEEHPRAGHDLTLDDPRWACERIARFQAAPGVLERAPVSYR